MLERLIGASLAAVLAATDVFDPSGVGLFVDRYGLPLAILGFFAWLILTRRFVTGSELAYVEARRIDERDRAIAAEATVKVLAESFEKIGGSMAEIAEVVEDAVLRAIAEEERNRVPRR
jgi:hypothetical protein